MNDFCNFEEKYAFLHAYLYVSEKDVVFFSNFVFKPYFWAQALWLNVEKFDE